MSVRPANVVFMHTETGRRLGTLDLGPAFRRRFGQPYILRAVAVMR